MSTRSRPIDSEEMAWRRGLIVWDEGVDCLLGVGCFEGKYEDSDDCLAWSNRFDKHPQGEG